MFGPYSSFQGGTATAETVAANLNGQSRIPEFASSPFGPPISAAFPFGAGMAMTPATGFVNYATPFVGAPVMPPVNPFVNPAFGVPGTLPAFPAFSMTPGYGVNPAIAPWFGSGIPVTHAHPFVPMTPLATTPFPAPINPLVGVNPFVNPAIPATVFGLPTIPTAVPPYGWAPTVFNPAFVPQSFFPTPSPMAGTFPFPAVTGSIGTTGYTNPFVASSLGYPISACPPASLFGAVNPFNTPVPPIGYPITNLPTAVNPITASTFASLTAAGVVHPLIAALCNPAVAGNVFCPPNIAGFGIPGVIQNILRTIPYTGATTVPSIFHGNPWTTPWNPYAAISPLNTILNTPFPHGGLWNPVGWNNPFVTGGTLNYASIIAALCGSPWQTGLCNPFAMTTPWAPNINTTPYAGIFHPASIPAGWNTWNSGVGMYPATGPVYTAPLVGVGAASCSPIGCL